MWVQTDQPGLIAAVGTAMAKQNLNISFMTVTRTGQGQEAIMAIGLDDQPSQVQLPANMWDKAVLHGLHSWPQDWHLPHQSMQGLRMMLSSQHTNARNEQSMTM